MTILFPDSLFPAFCPAHSSNRVFPAIVRAGFFISPILGEVWYNYLMHVISRKRLVEFWKRYPDAEQPLKAWYAEAKKAKWKTPAGIKAFHRNASILPNDRVVFNIKGNNYRLVLVVQYKKGVILIRFVGTHQEYDRIDAATI